MEAFFDCAAFFTVGCGVAVIVAGVSFIYENFFEKGE